MKAPFKWELIESDVDINTFRAKVEGGWLVNHIVYPCGQESLMVMTTTFVPDPQHNWIVDNEPKPQEEPASKVKEWKEGNPDYDRLQEGGDRYRGLPEGIKIDNEYKPDPCTGWKG